MKILEKKRKEKKIPPKIIHIYVRNNWRRAVELFEKIMHTQGGDAVTMPSGVYF